MSSRPESQPDRNTAPTGGGLLRGHLASRITVLVLALFLPLLAAGQVSMGDPFPDLRSVARGGATVPETAGKVMLVDFWASWCAPCKASFPALARLHAEFASRGLVIVGVSVDEKQAAYEAFVKKMQPPFAVVRDEQQKLVSTVKVPTMPTSYLVGADGRVRFVHRGFHGDATENELRKQIQSVLSEEK
jgi:thiol-disulfide isomerase/thioredoxin